MKKIFKRIIVIISVVCLVISGLLLCIWFIPAQYFPYYVGVLEIPDVGIEVPVVEVPETFGYNRATTFLVNSLRRFYVDKPNCAVLYFSNGPSGVVFEGEIYGSLVIGDHRSQTFGPIDKCTQGMRVDITRPNGVVDTYEVVSIFEGINAGNDLTYQDGKSVINDNPGGIILYSCMDSTSIPVYIVFLQPTTR